MNPSKNLLPLIIKNGLFINFPSFDNSSIIFSLDKSLISSDLFSSNAFQAGWTANGSEVVEASATAVANPNAGNDACVPKDNTALVINSVLDVQQFLSNNGFNPGTIEGQ